MTFKTTERDSTVTCDAAMTFNGVLHTLTGSGNGPIDAFVHALRDGLGISIDVLDYAEHAMGSGSEATAVAYVETKDHNGQVRWGIGTDQSIITASFHAVVSAVLRQRA